MGACVRWAAELGLEVLLWVRRRSEHCPVCEEWVLPAMQTARSRASSNGSFWRQGCLAELGSAGLELGLGGCEARKLTDRRATYGIFS